VALRDHEPIVIDKFNGLWDQGDPEKTPLDHWRDVENVDFVGQSSCKSRDGLDIYEETASPLGQVFRIYNYITQDANTLLVLTFDGTDGSIYHVAGPATVLGPILTIEGMTDFGFAPYAGRAYITPFASFAQGDVFIEKGLEDEFVYTYLGDGSAARKAGGTPLSGALTIGNGAAGFTDAGFHVFAVVAETDTGYLTPPAAFGTHTTSASLSVSFSTIPTSVDSFVVRRHIVATKVIPTYNGNTTGYQFFFIPNATIEDNVSTTLPNISFFDADLLEDASHLLDNFSEIPAGVGLTIYHNRMCLYTSFDDISLVRVSAVGEPEAFSQLDGFLIVPPDGNPITNAQELRDVFYVCKRNRTVSFVDNDDVPTTWPMTVIDTAIGCPVHGIASVLDQGANSVDFLIMASFSGIIIFNGRYIQPELSWKISNFWLGQNRVNFNRIQILNDSITKVLWVTLPDRRLLKGNYANGMDPKNIRWTIFRADITVNTVALVNINDFVIGAAARLTV